MVVFLLYCYFFYEAIFLFIISAFCWSLAIHNILLLNIKKKYKIFFVGLILAIIFGSGAYKQDYIFLVCAVIFTPIFLYLLRKKLHNFYIFKLQKSLIAFGLFGTMVCVWQLEVPQRIIVNFFGLKINIVDCDYVVLEHKVWNMKDNILVTNWVQYDNFLNYISFDKADIFICDEIDCKGNKKKIGEISMPSMPRSTLGCINSTGRCLGVINPPGLEIETFRNYLREQSIKKTINKLN